MATMAREAWTDERLDDLKGSVDAGFRDNREEFRALRAEIQGVRSEVAAINRSVHQFTWSVILAMLAGFLSVLATVLIQA